MATAATTRGRWCGLGLKRRCETCCECTLLGCLCLSLSCCAHTSCSWTSSARMAGPHPSSRFVTTLGPVEVISSLGKYLLNSFIPLKISPSWLLSRVPRQNIFCTSGKYCIYLKIYYHKVECQATATKAQKVAMESLCTMTQRPGHKRWLCRATKILASVLKSSDGDGFV